MLSLFLSGMLLACIGFEASGLVKDGQITDIIKADAWPVWLSLAGLMLIGTLSHYNVKGGILMGVVLCAVIYWQCTATFPAKIVQIPAIKDTWMKYDFSGFQPSVGVPAVLTFLLVALFDCSGCLVGLSMKAGLITNVAESVPGGTWALVASGFGTIVAACTGCSPIIIAVECTAGILEGGRTGLTALTAAFLFAVSLFFSPLFGAVPIIASAPVLILIGSMMMREVGQIEWAETRVALPAFLTIALMPLSHSISNGVWFGLGASIIMGLTTHQAWKRIVGSDDALENNAHHGFRVMTPTGGGAAAGGRGEFGERLGFRAPIFTSGRVGFSGISNNLRRGFSDDDPTRPLMINDDA
jgi:AGZA family xanthine/uracil permease-like MFS transporter